MYMLSTANSSCYTSMQAHQHVHIQYLRVLSPSTERDWVTKPIFGVMEVDTRTGVGTHAAAAESEELEGTHVPLP